MTAPAVTFTVEPFSNGSLLYGPLAPPDAGADAGAQLSMVLEISNQESTAVHLVGLDLSFQGGAPTPPVTIPMDLEIAANAQAVWYGTVADNQFLPQPVPDTVTLDLICEGFADPATLVLALTPHVNPTPTGSYRFPSAAADLDGDEYWVGRSGGHGPAGGGTQFFAYDFGVLGWDATASLWTQVLPGTTGDKNDEWRIYGKPIRAMADGVVVQSKNDMAENTKMGKQVPTPNPVEGNHLYIQHGDEIALYAHLQPGSIPSALAEGATVSEGDLLGLAGNSGNSTNPHLHIHVLHATKPWGGPPRPLLFHAIAVHNQATLGTPPVSGGWTMVSGQGLPAAPVAVSPTPVPMEKGTSWELLVWLFLSPGVLSDGGGFGRKPGGGGGPIGPWDPLHM
ncbi:MAG: M23 family metallopeptidase, partial [Acidimicrobiia bacterium]